MNEIIKEEYNYVLVPLPMLQEIFKRPKTAFEDILSVGLYASAKNQKTTMEWAITQAVYCFYHSPDELPVEIHNYIVDELPEYLDREGFDLDKNFDPIDQLPAFCDFIEDNDGLGRLIKKWSGVRMLLERYKLNMAPMKIISTYDKYYKRYKYFKDDAKFMVKAEKLLEFANGSKTEFERVEFAVYLGIRSLIGRDKVYARTNYQMVFYRMIGAKDKEVASIILKDARVKLVYSKYKTRTLREKLMKRLLADNYLKSKLGMDRSLYLSCSLGCEELDKAIEATQLNSKATKMEINRELENVRRNRIRENVKNKKKEEAQQLINEMLR